MVGSEQSLDYFSRDAAAKPCLLHLCEDWEVSSAADICGELAG